MRWSETCLLFYCCCSGHFKIPACLWGGGSKDWHQVSSLIVSLRQSLTEPEFANSANLVASKPLRSSCFNLPRCILRRYVLSTQSCITQACTTPRLFTWVLGNRTQAFTLAQQTLYWLTYHPSLRDAPLSLAFSSPLSWTISCYPIWPQIWPFSCSETFEPCFWECVCRPGWYYTGDTFWVLLVRFVWMDLRSHRSDDFVGQLVVALLHSWGDGSSKVNTTNAVSDT